MELLVLDDLDALLLFFVSAAAAAKLRIDKVLVEVASFEKASDDVAIKGTADGIDDLVDARAPFVKATTVAEVGPSMRRTRN